MFVAKIVQTEGRKPSLLEFYAEVQPILYKDKVQIESRSLMVRYCNKLLIFKN